jgi:hypothetical protein
MRSRKNLFDNPAISGIMTEGKTFSGRRLSMSKLFPCIFLIFALSLTACGDGIKAQDKEFIANIKQHLKKVGDTAKVEDIHPGDWEKVCFNPISAYSNIEVKNTPEGLRSNGTEIINNANTYANDKIWGVYFRYRDNKAEYYRIPWDVMYWGGVEEKNSCVDRGSATFEVIGDFNNRKSVNPVATVAQDFIELRLTNDKKGD